jgi:hypothetical protein
VLKWIAKPSGRHRRQPNWSAALADLSKTKDMIAVRSAALATDPTLRAAGEELHRVLSHALGYEALQSSDKSDLDDGESLFMRHYPAPLVFSVISWGCAATGWLAYTLNSHPDIYCVHAANTFWSRLGGQPLIDGVPYMRVIGSQGYAHKAAGDVHGISRQCVGALRKEFGDNFGCAVVVRDPIPRLRSQIALFASFKYDKQSWGDLRYLDEICRDSGIVSENISYTQRLFIHGVNMLNAILDEIGIAKIYRCEDLTCTPGKLREFVIDITNNKVSVTDQWVEQAISGRRINAHVVSSVCEFDDWQRQVIQAVVKPEAWGAYRSLG